MHLRNPPYPIPEPQRRRIIKRRPVKLRRRHPAKPPQLKYGNILFLTIILIAFGWITTIPFRNRRPLEPPIISAQPSLSPANLSPPITKEDLGFVYNIRRKPSQIYNTELQKIVDEAVDIARRKGLPIEPLSISLIDVSSNRVHRFAGYQNQTLRYPASVAKLFWMVAFYSAVEYGLIENKSALNKHVKPMIEISHNDAASRVLDAITDTHSGKKLRGKELEIWLGKRKSVNEFFQSAGYEGIVVSTKNYPIYYLKQQGPVGRDRQLRDDDQKFLKNRASTDHAARLIYEIYTRQAVSREYSTMMAYLLTRDLDPKAWRNDPSNGIKGFLGESLPTNIYFGSKVGYTSKSRQDVAFIRTLDDRVIYILAIFAEEPAYAKNEDIFPEMSRHIFNRMVERGSR